MRCNPVRPCRRTGHYRGVTQPDGYLLDNRRAEAGDRFAAMARLLDPWTTQHLSTLGVDEGWRCWEVGAGGVGIPEWLAERVGPTGEVIATDIDLSWLGGSTAPNLDVREHDVTIDPPPGLFDLVHARLVLVHLTERDKALAAMIGALRPGGWLLLEDADPALQPLACPDEYGPEQVRANRLRTAFRGLLSGRGADLSYGRTLPRLLRSAGLVGVQAAAYFPLGGPESDRLEAATIRHIRDGLVGAGLATAEDIDLHLEAVEAGRLDVATAPLISVWGCKTAESAANAYAE